MGFGRRLAAVALTFAVAACGGTASPLPSGSAAPASPSGAGATATPGPPTAAPPPVDHRIGVRVVDGSGEFYDRTTGERFVPRGANLIRLAGGRHSTLNIGHYDTDRLDAAFARMADDGYNTVRIFMDTYPGGLPGAGEPLSSTYLDHVTDALGRAKAHGLVVLLTQDWLPESAEWAFASDPGIEDVNSLYLSTGGVAANERAFQLFAEGLVERGASLDALLAYELRNELYFTDRYAPFSLRNGSLRMANGETYDMGSADDRRRALEDNLVHWIDRMRTAIVAVDPTALVTVGFFQPQGPNTSRVGDDRLIETREAILRSTADFIDLHGYPGGELTLRQLVENFGLPPVTAKPILLGEFGAEHGAHPTAEDAVRALVEWQVESCTYGFDGWLVWTWDTLEQPEFWNALDADGAIERALAPATRPDPCSIGDIGLSVELARGATASASQAAGDGPAAHAVDGLVDTIWSASNDAPQWIELDLGAERTVDTIRLLVAQSPAGPTRHVVSVRGSPGTYRTVATLEQSTTDGDWLEVHPDTVLTGVRFVRVETTRSPSWVAWREISVLGQAGE